MSTSATDSTATAAPAAAGATLPALAPLLHGARPGWDRLEADYGPLLALVDTILGVVPNCDRYLEIWPPAFRTYNVMVPNLLNLPAPVLGVGGPPAHVVGLAMYVASRTAACPYCSAHSCSFAMRRGATAEQVAAALLPEGLHSFSRGELAAIAVARSMARVPGELTVQERDELIEVFGEKKAEWVVLAVSMMGFLNKFMDAIGVELEQSVVTETLDTLGSSWTPGKAGAELDPNRSSGVRPPVDGLRTRMRLLPLLPAAVRYDRKVQRGVPARATAVARFLTARTGHDFPVLATIHSNRARRSITTMISENLDASTSVVGLRTKVLAGAVYAELARSRQVAADIRALAAGHGITANDLSAARAFAGGEPLNDPEQDPAVGAALALARAAASSPAAIDAEVVAACAEHLAADAIVEIVTWLAVLQLLHRLGSFTMLDR